MINPYKYELNFANEGETTKKDKPKIKRFIFSGQFRKRAISFKIGIRLSKNRVFILGGIYFAFKKSPDRWDDKKFLYLYIYLPCIRMLGVNEYSDIAKIGITTD